MRGMKENLSYVAVTPELEMLKSEEEVKGQHVLPSGKVRHRDRARYQAVGDRCV